MKKRPRKFGPEKQAHPVRWEGETRIWKCDICGFEFRWREGAASWGKLEEPEYVVCSALCRSRLSERLGVSNEPIDEIKPARRKKA